MRENIEKLGQIEEIFLSCPPGNKRLATALIATSFRFSLDGLQLTKCTPYQHLYSHIRQFSDALWSTRQIEIKFLTQGHKYASRSRAQTHH